MFGLSKLSDFIKGSIKIVETYGPFKIIFSCFMMMFISYATYLTLNPSFIFDRFAEYEEQRHSESFNYRMESTPYVQSILDDLVLRSNAMRGFVVEMHNGKYNASGLSFNYGSMTYEGLRDGAYSVSEDYDDFTLDRFPILIKTHKDGIWYGTTEELKKIDRRMALKLESNDANYLILTVIYGIKNEIGFIGVTYGKNDEFNYKDMVKMLTKYSAKISPYLDGDKARKN